MVTKYLDLAQCSIESYQEDIPQNVYVILSCEVSICAQA